MEHFYKLKKIRDLAGDDEEFIKTIALTFLKEIPEDTQKLQDAVKNKDYELAFQAAHKMKPTIDLFGLPVYDDLIEIQDWGKYEKKDIDISSQLQLFSEAIENAVNEIQSDFNS